jgi:hypothetical protein
MQYPVTFTWEQLAELPTAAEHFDWAGLDQHMYAKGLAEVIQDYSAYLIPIDGFGRLATYLVNIGFIVTEEGVTVLNREALYTADALLHQVMLEYDETETTPTWELFGLSGDDSVDYFGTQPSCLTKLLLDQH